MNKLTMTKERDIWSELLAQKAEALAGIAGSSNDNAKLRQLTEWLGRELDLEAKYKGLLSEAERLIAERQQPVAAKPNRENATNPVSSGNDGSGWKLTDLEKGERARVARAAFFEREKAKGNNYRKVGRIYYRKDDGSIMGITFSSDKGGGRWFLNLLEDQFQEGVFLCQTGLRSVKAIRLPKSFIDRYGKQLSKDGKGEIKFNFLRDGTKWLLEVPQPVGPVDVTSFVEPEELVCTRIEYA